MVGREVAAGCWAVGFHTLVVYRHVNCIGKMPISSSCTLLLLDHDKGSCMEVAKCKHGHGRIVQLPVWLLTFVLSWHSVSYRDQPGGFSHIDQHLMCLILIV